MTNMKRLDVSKLQKQALGTAVGLNTREENAIMKESNGKIFFEPGDCLQFMREQIQWD